MILGTVYSVSGLKMGSGVVILMSVKNILKNHLMRYVKIMNSNTSLVKRIDIVEIKPRYIMYLCGFFFTITIVISAISVMLDKLVFAVLSLLISFLFLFIGVSVGIVRILGDIKQEIKEN